MVNQSTTKEARIYNREKISILNQWCWENWTDVYRRIKLEHSLIPYIKINSKWIKDLNVIPNTVKLLKENIGRILFDINCSSIFLFCFGFLSQGNEKKKKDKHMESVSSYVCFGNFYLSRNLSFSSNVSNLLTHSFSQYSLRCLFTSIV